MITGSPVLSNATAVEYGPYDGLIYWADRKYRCIQCARLDGSNRKLVLSGVYVEDMVIHWKRKRIYWTDPVQLFVGVATLKGEWHALVKGDMVHPRAIALDSDNDYLYWTDWGEAAKIERAAVNGSMRQVLIDTEIAWPNALALDTRGGCFYWADAKLDKIEVVALNGTWRRELSSSVSWHELLPHVRSLDVRGDYLYWSDQIRMTVERARKFDLSDRETLIANLSEIVDIRVWSMSMDKLRQAVQSTGDILQLQHWRRVGSVGIPPSTATEGIGEQHNLDSVGHRDSSKTLVESSGLSSDSAIALSILVIVIVLVFMFLISAACFCWRRSRDSTDTPDVGGRPAEPSSSTALPQSPQLPVVAQSSPEAACSGIVGPVPPQSALTTDTAFGCAVRFAAGEPRWHTVSSRATALALNNGHRSRPPPAAGFSLSREASELPAQSDDWRLQRVVEGCEGERQSLLPPMGSIAPPPSVVSLSSEIEWGSTSTVYLDVPRKYIEEYKRRKASASITERDVTPVAEAVPTSGYGSGSRKLSAESNGLSDCESTYSVYLDVPRKYLKEYKRRKALASKTERDLAPTADVATSGYDRRSRKSTNVARSNGHSDRGSNSIVYRDVPRKYMKEYMRRKALAPTTERALAPATDSVPTSGHSSSSSEVSDGNGRSGAASAAVPHRRRQAPPGSHVCHAARRELPCTPPPTPESSC